MHKRLGTAIAAALAALLIFVASASAALSDEAGWPCNADSSKAGWTLLASPQPGWSISPLVKEPRAVITSWRSRVGPGLEPRAQQLGVFRAVNGGAEYTKVAESATETFGEGTEAVPARIPVQGGDLVGLHGPVETFVCGGLESGGSALFEGSVGLGETRAFKTEGGIVPAVSATVEADADGDGYGDASQDDCPESAVFQTICPLVTLSIGEVSVKRRAILIRVRNNTEASVEARGEVRWWTQPKAAAGTARSSKGRQVRVGLSTDAPTSVTPGQTAVLRVPLPKAVLRQLDRLPPGQSLRARIDVKATNLVPYVGTHELKVRLPGRAQPQPKR